MKNLNRRTITLMVVGILVVVAGVFVVALLLPRVFNQGGGAGVTSKQGASGGLIAVSANGTEIAAAADSKLPDNTAVQVVGMLHVSLALSPYPPVGWQNSDFKVTLEDEKGQAVNDATISLDLTMPGMWMPANSLEAQHAGEGVYEATGMFTMRDLWQIEVIIERGGEKSSAFFDVRL